MKLRELLSVVLSRMAIVDFTIEGAIEDYYQSGKCVAEDFSTTLARTLDDKVLNREVLLIYSDGSKRNDLYVTIF